MLAPWAPKPAPASPGTHAEDLRLEEMRRKVGQVGKLLPRRDLRGHEALIRYLEEESAEYRAAAQAGRGQGRPRA